MKTSGFTGTGTLIRLFLRRDRIALPAWIVFLAISLMGTVSSYKVMFKTAAEQRSAVDMIMNTPAIKAMSGPVFGYDLGSLVVYKMGTLMLSLVALMSLLTVINHTRGEEEAGRFDLLCSNIVGRYAMLTAGFIVTVGANVIIALLFIFILAGNGFPMAGAAAYGLSWASVGCMFAAIAGIAAQLTESAGAAKSIAGGILGLSYLMRAVGDVGGDQAQWLSWISPLGLAQRIRPFAGERWWIFGIFAVISLLFSYMAYKLSSRRDIGAGLLPQRQGPAEASPRLRNPLALAWRLQKAGLIGWAGSLAIFGLGIASMAKAFQKLDEGNPKLKEIFSKLGGQGSSIDMVFVMMMGMFGLAVSIYAIQAALRLRSEEESLRTEPLLSGPVSRLNLAVSHLVYAVVGPAVILALTGLVMGLTYGFYTGNAGRDIPRLIAAAMVQLPAVWAIAGLAFATVGLLPRLVVINWAALIAFLMLGQLGDLLKLDRSVMNLSPFTHIPKLPGSEVSAAPLLWLTAIAFVLILAGLTGYRRRDIR